jgi:hypothetical protein
MVPARGGDAHSGSDWDFAFVAGPGFDELGLRAALARALHTDAIDLADLQRAGAVLRYQVARDGQPVLEREPGEIERAVCARNTPSQSCRAPPVRHRILTLFQASAAGEAPRCRAARNLDC